MLNPHLGASLRVLLRERIEVRECGGRERIISEILRRLRDSG
jgi:hypothetical protein